MEVVGPPLHDLVEEEYVRESAEVFGFCATLTEDAPTRKCRMLSSKIITHRGQHLVDRAVCVGADKNALAGSVESLHECGERGRLPRTWRAPDEAHATPKGSTHGRALCRVERNAGVVNIGNSGSRRSFVGRGQYGIGEGRPQRERPGFDLVESFLQRDEERGVVDSKDA